MYKHARLPPRCKGLHLIWCWFLSFTPKLSYCISLFCSPASLCVCKKGPLPEASLLVLPQPSWDILDSEMYLSYMVFFSIPSACSLWLDPNLAKHRSRDPTFSHAHTGTLFQGWTADSMNTHQQGIVGSAFTGLSFVSLSPWLLEINAITVSQAILWRYPEK